MGISWGNMGIFAIKNINRTLKKSIQRVSSTIKYISLFTLMQRYWKRINLKKVIS